MQTKKKKDVLSYKELMKMVQTYHPLDPLTLNHFGICDKTTIKEYGLKMTDCVGCRHIYGCFNSCMKKCGKIVIG